MLILFCTNFIKFELFDFFMKQELHSFKDRGITNHSTFVASTIPSGFRHCHWYLPEKHRAANGSKRKTVEETLSFVSFYSCLTACIQKSSWKGTERLGERRASLSLPVGRTAAVLASPRRHLITLVACIYINPLSTSSFSTWTRSREERSSAQAAL